MTDNTRASNNTSGKTGNYIEVARQERTVLLRIHGLGNMNISHVLHEFVEAQLKLEYKNFVVDLDPCKGMDSTFMGTLVGMSSAVKDKGGWLCLVNVSDQNRELLKMIGVWGLVPIKDGHDIKAVETECLRPDRRSSSRLRHIRDAHKNLVKVDERNKEKFGRFLAELEREMAESGLSEEEFESRSLPKDNDKDDNTNKNDTNNQAGQG